MALISALHIFCSFLKKCPKSGKHITTIMFDCFVHEFKWSLLKPLFLTGLKQFVRGYKQDRAFAAENTALLNRKGQ